MYQVVVHYDDTVDVMPLPDPHTVGFDNVEDAVAHRNNVARMYRESEPGHGAISVLVMYGAREWV